MDRLLGPVTKMQYGDKDNEVSEVRVENDNLIIPTAMFDKGAGNTKVIEIKIRGELIRELTNKNR